MCPKCPPDLNTYFNVASNICADRETKLFVSAAAESGIYRILVINPTAGERSRGISGSAPPAS